MLLTIGSLQTYHRENRHAVTRTILKVRGVSSDFAAFLCIIPMLKLCPCIGPSVTRSYTKHRFTGEAEITQMFML
jgi:hypothetical protein